MSNVLKGSVSGTGLLKGSVAAILGKDGYSAYEIACQNGFEGTEKEWLDSLKGEPGKDGSVDFEALTPEQMELLKGEDGNPGKDGVSATHSWNGTVLTVTSASGTSSADLKGEPGIAGKDGKDGQPGKDGKDGYTPQKNADYFDGEPGKDGEPGQDGFSPTVSVSKVGKTTTITITDVNGTKTATIKDGEDGTGGGGGTGTDGEDGIGIASIVQTTKSTEDDGINVMTITLTDGSVHIFEVQNGSKGSKGDAGYTPVKGKDYFDGAKGDPGYTPQKGVDYFDGTNGTSCTHYWSGTTLVVSSASGTSSANLKGDKGDTGSAGSNGIDGTSVTVKTVSESTADGGNNVITFSDGKTVTVKNGRTGSAGKDGNPGVYIGSGTMPAGYNVQIDPNGSAFAIADLLTSADKTAIAIEAAALIDESLLPIIGEVS